MVLCYIYFIIFYHRNNTWFISNWRSYLKWCKSPDVTFTRITMSVCIKKQLKYSETPMFTTCYNSWCSSCPCTPFRKCLFNLFELCDSSPKLVKNFNICRHNVCEHIPMYGTWFINVIHITFGVRYSLNTNLNIILSISSIWLYAVTYLFQILDSTTFGWWRLPKLHFNIYQCIPP